MYNTCEYLPTQKHCQLVEFRRFHPDSSRSPVSFVRSRFEYSVRAHRIPYNEISDSSRVPYILLPRMPAQNYSGTQSRWEGFGRGGVVKWEEADPPTTPFSTRSRLWQHCVIPAYVYNVRTLFSLSTLRHFNIKIPKEQPPIPCASTRNKWAPTLNF